MVNEYKIFLLSTPARFPRFSEEAADQFEKVSFWLSQNTPLLTAHISGKQNG